MTQSITQHVPERLGNVFVREDWDNLTFRVDREAYRSAEVFAAERERVWMKTWVYLGHETEIPRNNDYRVRVIAGKPLIFVRDNEGKIRVFLNSCPHRGTTLCREAEGNSRHLQCFYHAWTFTTSGEIAAIPGEDAYDFSRDFRDSVKLRAVPRVDSHEGFVFISFAEEGPSLEEHLGAAADVISMATEQSAAGMVALPGIQRYGIKGNWKLAVENAMDGYHFAPTHNTFVGYLRETGFHVTDDDQYGYNLGNGHSMLVLTGHNGRLGMLWEPRFGEEEKERTRKTREEMAARLGRERADTVGDASRILFVFPNLLLFDLEALTIRQLEPLAAGETDVRAWQYVPTDESDQAREIRLRTMASFVGPGGLATPDDIEAYEAVQRGIVATAGDRRGINDYSDMSRGMISEVRGEKGRSIDEGQMRTFWRHWSRAVGEVNGSAEEDQS
ncbi:p-cumate dioxygenase [Rhodococcus sp. ACPA4]|uniref:aromatic ring-hydroxylating oxygenase subunit alpha n=1 Tax=Rhodococcus sp. ACPA4 TaxID=2028571 RepID=UPI000BB1509B|nr:aromatic ring-hydroxylating dioxygenase subunit alpha [Rhodococcus sp. ACPA4]PBC35892.1 p-cumate dioxygenase [Rhodococcus sp. ACPA4]